VTAVRTDIYVMLVESVAGNAMDVVAALYAAGRATRVSEENILIQCDGCSQGLAAE